MRKLILAIGLMILGAMAQKSLQPMSALAQAKPVAPVAGPVITLPQVDATSEQAILPLATQRQSLEDQIRPLLVKLNEVNKTWRMVEAQALVKAKLDPAEYRLKRDGKSFESRQGIPGR